MQETLETALAALDLLAKIAPNRAAAWDDKRLEVYRLRYLRGDRKDKFINGRQYVVTISGNNLVAFALRN